MMMGHFFEASGIMNCTYIWPTVICTLFVTPAVEVANFVVFGTPPTKKLPTSQICSDFVRNPACALEATRAKIADKNNN